MLKQAQRGTIRDQGHRVPEQRARVHRLLTPKHQKSCSAKTNTLAAGDCWLRNTHCSTYAILEGWLAREGQMTGSSSDFTTTHRTPRQGCAFLNPAQGSDLEASLRSLRPSQCPARPTGSQLPSSSGLCTWDRSLLATPATSGLCGLSLSRERSSKSQLLHLSKEIHLSLGVGVGEVRIKGGL